MVCLLWLLSYRTLNLIEQIREKVAADQFEFSQHAVDQSILRRISVQELREAIASGEVIEDYPDDKYGPSCLIFGCTAATRPLHVQSGSGPFFGQPALTQPYQRRPKTRT